MSCSCGGYGIYMDRHCLDDVCAHAHYLVPYVETVGEKVIDKMKDTGRVMECPLRVCVCKAGRDYARNRVE